MTLVDTSVWIDHLRKGDNELAELLSTARVWTHPFVVGEIACGNLLKRNEVLALLGELPRVPVASDNEVLHLIERHSLMGRGLGYIDAHLLASTLIEGSSVIWTRDKRLHSVADSLGVGNRDTG